MEGLEKGEKRNLKEIKVLSPTAILGYGFPESSFREGLKQEPDVIAVDGGSTDPGPYYLGAGVSFTDREAVKRDLKIMLRAGVKHHLPVLVGTAGGSGGKIHLEWCVEIVKEIARENGFRLRVGLIDAEINKDTIKDFFRKGRVSPLFPAPETSIEEIEASSRIVAQMGVEPIIQALNEGVDLILAGRAYDPSIFAAAPVKEGFPPGLALHMGKILECASIAAESCPYEGQIGRAHV